MCHQAIEKTFLDPEVFAQVNDTPQDWHSLPNDTESEKQRNTGRHGEWGKKRHNKDHRMEKVKVLLKDLVLELSTKDGS